MNNHKTISVISITYLALVSGFLIWHHAWFSPDQFFALAILTTLFLGRFKQFIKDWSFPTVLFLSYEYLRGVVPHLSSRVYITPMIDFDQKFFGSLPTIMFQQILFSDQSIHWYDKLAVLFYMSHFIVPMLVGFIFWLSKKSIFKDYFAALLILSYLAFITYIIFPAMPPWMASDKGYVPHINHIMDQVFGTFTNFVSLPTIYKFFGANLVAAVPSLHAAYPFLTLLFLVNRFRWWGVLAIPYVLGVWFSIVYLGEHYVFDILVGVVYASLAYVLVTKRRYIFKKIVFSSLNFLKGGEV